jgi:hypothetical protein
LLNFLFILFHLYIFNIKGKELDLTSTTEILAIHVKLNVHEIVFMRNKFPSSSLDWKLSQFHTLPFLHSLILWLVFPTGSSWSMVINFIILPLSLGRHHCQWWAIFRTYHPFSANVCNTADVYIEFSQYLILNHYFLKGKLPIQKKCTLTV